MIRARDVAWSAGPGPILQHWRKKISRKQPAFGRTSPREGCSVGKKLPTPARTGWTRWQSASPAQRGMQGRGGTVFDPASRCSRGYPRPHSYQHNPGHHRDIQQSVLWAWTGIRHTGTCCRLPPTPVQGSRCHYQGACLVFSFQQLARACWKMWSFACGFTIRVSYPTGEPSPHSPLHSLWGRI